MEPTMADLGGSHVGYPALESARSSAARRSMAVASSGGIGGWGSSPQVAYETHRGYVMSRLSPSSRVSKRHRRMKTTNHAPCTAAAIAFSVHSEQQGGAQPSWEGPRLGLSLAGTRGALAGTGLAPSLACAAVMDMSPMLRRGYRRRAIVECARANLRGVWPR